MLRFRHRLKRQRHLTQLFVYLKNCSIVSHSVAVVRCRPYSDEFFIKPVVVTLVYQLVGPAHQIQIIYPAEVLRHFRSKQPPSTSGTYCPCLYIIGVRPHEIGICSRMWYLLLPIDVPYLINSFYIWREATVYA